MGIVGSQAVTPIASGEDGLRQLASDDLRPRTSSLVVAEIAMASPQDDVGAFGNADVAPETANEDGQGKSDLRDTEEDDERNRKAIVEETAASDPSAEPKLPWRAATPTRRVGKLSIGSAREDAVQVMGTPPRRRAASVFGTRGREIVTYPAPVTTSALLGATAVQELPDDQEYETSVQNDAAIDLRERESNETEAPGDDQETNHDSSGAHVTERRIYVRFKDLPRDTGAAYVHVLMGLFADNPGDDAVALVFEDAKDVIKIAAPMGVDYDEVSEVVQNIVGEDAVVEVIE